MLSRWQNHIVDESGNVVPSAPVEIRLAGEGTPATIYSDAEGAAKANPFTATVGGLAEFWASGGLYDIYVDGGLTWSDVQIGSAQRADLADPNEVAAGTAADDQIPTVAGINLALATVAVVRRVEKPATGALAVSDIIGTILTNYGQTAENIQTLPDTDDVVTALGAGAEVGFVVRVETEGAGALGLKPGAGDKHYFDDGTGVVALDNGAAVVFAAPGIGDTLVVTMIRTGESSFDWLTACIRGTAGE